MIIALDGPAGSGKSSVAKQVASALGFHYLDTGAMYRACAVLALKKGFSVESENEVRELAEGCRIDFAYDEGTALPSKIFIDGHEVTEQIRTPEIDAAVSPVSKHKAVRDAMVAKQRELSSEGNYVVEGRDIGTVVFPQAELKIFMTASPEVRAKRRSLQNEQSGLPSEYEKIYRGILARDEADTQRTVSPLRPADDAIILDTSNLSQQEVLDIIIELACERMPAREGKK